MRREPGLEILAGAAAYVGDEILELSLCGAELIGVGLEFVGVFHPVVQVCANVGIGVVERGPVTAFPQIALCVRELLLASLEEVVVHGFNHIIDSVVSFLGIPFDVDEKAAVG